MSKQALVLGESDSDNLGDQLIAACMAAYFRDCGMSVRCESLTLGLNALGVGDGGDAAPQLVRFRKLLPRSAKAFIWLLRSWHVMLKKIHQDDDLIIFGGGQLIHGNPYFALCMYAWSVRARWLGIAYGVFSVGVSERFSWLERWLYKRVLKNAGFIVVRDERSQSNLNDIFNHESKLVPDIAYYEPVVNPECDRSLVLICPLDYAAYFEHHQHGRLLSELEYLDMWCRIVDSVYATDEVVLGHTTYRDYLAARKVADLCKKKLSVSVDLVGYPQTPASFRVLCLKAKCVITGRMHAMIMADTSGARFVAYLTSPKIKGFVRGRNAASVNRALLCDARAWFGGH